MMMELLVENLQICIWTVVDPGRGVKAREGHVSHSGKIGSYVSYIYLLFESATAAL